VEPTSKEAESLFPGRMFHIGVIVEDLECGMAEWSEVLGVRWRPLFSGVSEIHRGGAMTTMPIPAVYSEDGPVHLELIPLTRGTVWDVLGLHHVGFWSDDVAADIDRLVARGASVEAQMKRDGEILAAYLTLAMSRIEIIASTSRERLIGAS
jgi:Glyoxalase/Bleomycin resistance protein/Dioxygenase superfamily